MFCRKNIDFLVGDATQMDLPDNCCDVVFSNWLLMYLDDQECADLASDALAWVSHILLGSPTSVLI